MLQYAAAPRERPADDMGWHGEVCVGLPHLFPSHFFSGAAGFRVDYARTASLVAFRLGAFTYAWSSARWYYSR
ncbi:hypothetical protein GUJ93_ZPchr0354g33714 [Zizania palustris]|uniref:Uncharacterized protein n=1 Tax=Zizania palustris TaxID=103762 RepID=A0A8J5R5K9_ZIZPA|nr:hypothetical protein GUJ93_ZPchr0354g33714 [Zizania palustris]